MVGGGEGIGPGYLDDSGRKTDAPPPAQAPSPLVRRRSSVDRVVERASRSGDDAGTGQARHNHPTRMRPTPSLAIM